MNSIVVAKKLTKELGLGYEKIDACPNDCMIYWVRQEINNHVIFATLQVIKVT